eukprot:m.114019 g.114019  ORF g.114019 m.114019 type:complete len:117 (-) comp28319_c0_seq1:353-703(-)
MEMRQIAGILGASGVALGAFGAHLLKATLTERGTLASWTTGVNYQMIHAVALLAMNGFNGTNDRYRLTSKLWVAGVVLFSGSIYGLSLGIGPKKILGPMTPIGGLCFVAGWTLLAL